MKETEFTEKQNPVLVVLYGNWRDLFLQLQVPSQHY